MVSVKVEVDNGFPKNKSLVAQLKHRVPEEYWRLYKRNVVPLTPKKSSWLRRSIRHSIIGNTLTIWWDAKYAGNQNFGSHSVRSKRVVNIDGNFVTLMPGRYPYSRYTTAGTGAGFKERAADLTRAQFMEEFYKNNPEYR